MEEGRSKREEMFDVMVSELVFLFRDVLLFCRKSEEKSVKNCGKREVSFAGSTELRIYGNTDEGDACGGITEIRS